MRLASLALVSSLLASSLGAAALAQPAPGAPAGQDGAGRHAWRRPDPAQMAERHAEHLRAVLQLRPDQEPALRALVAALQPDAAKMQRREAERGQARPQLTTPQALDRMQSRMAEHQADFARHADAIKRFYAQLTPTQQRAFDALHEGMGHRGMGGRMGHGPHGMKGPGPGMGPGMMGPGGPGAPPPAE